MSVMTYCCDVQARVQASKPADDDPLAGEWFADTGRASNAVTAAIDGRDDDALAIAEREGLEPGTDAYHERAKRFADEISRRTYTHEVRR